MKTFSLVAGRLLFALLTVTGASAGAEPGMFAPERSGNYYWYLGGGGYRPDSNAQLSNQEGRFGIAGGLGYRYSSGLAWEADFLDGFQKLDTPATILPAGYGTTLQGTVDQQATLSTLGVAATARFIYPLGRLEPYAGGGVGWYDIELRATGQQQGIPMEFISHASGPGWHVLAGADYHLSNRTSLGVEFRLRKIRVDMDNIALGRVEVGGSFVSLLLRSAI